MTEFEVSFIRVTETEITVPIVAKTKAEAIAMAKKGTYDFDKERTIDNGHIVEEKRFQCLGEVEVVDEIPSIGECLC